MDPVRRVRIGNAAAGRAPARYPPGAATREAASRTVSRIVYVARGRMGRFDPDVGPIRGPAGRFRGGARMPPRMRPGIPLFQCPGSVADPSLRPHPLGPGKQTGDHVLRNIAIDGTGSPRHAGAAFGRHGHRPGRGRSPPIAGRRGRAGRLRATRLPTEQATGPDSIDRFLPLDGWPGIRLAGPGGSGYDPRATGRPSGRSAGIPRAGGPGVAPPSRRTG